MSVIHLLPKARHRTVSRLFHFDIKIKCNITVAWRQKVFMEREPHALNLAKGQYRLLAYIRAEEPFNFAFIYLLQLELWCSWCKQILCPHKWRCDNIMRMENNQQGCKWKELPIVLQNFNEKFCIQICIIPIFLLDYLLYCSSHCSTLATNVTVKLSSIIIGQCLK